MLKNPRITEKATMHQSESVYTFDVDMRATKRDIIAAVRAIYKVTPRKVAVVTVPSKTRRSMKTGMRGVSKGGRKAYVYLTKGETITIA
jgi:large subunit ribosomal protein L23